MPRPIPWLLALGAAICVMPCSAQLPAADPVGLRGDIGGLWYDPDNSGQGLHLDVLDGGRVTLSWYTFDAEGRPLWLIGLGEVDGDAADLALSQASGGRFPTLADDGDVAIESVGTARIVFSGCDTAELDFSSSTGELPDGVIGLHRLTATQGVRCHADEEFGERRHFSFERGALQFSPVFADLPPDGQDIYELEFAWETLPAPLQARRGIRLGGHNRSDDLAMLVKAPLRGLQPDALYRVELALEMASDVPRGCAGVGGSPGDSVYMKLGASAIEPLAVEQMEGAAPILRLNIDFGVQSTSGTQALVVGDLANTQSCDDLSLGRWELKSLNTRSANFRARTDATGTLWVVAGLDSAFEGRTDVYFTALDVYLEPVAE
ncbi:MAG: hypothetical protein KDJ14_05315 [Xanthomonadales bacterium]|nr:hypothetical protein [Xanthomonadales bacterium]